MEKYYVIEREYVGPNQQDHLNDHTYAITTIPGRTNMSHEARTDGWLGTTNDWAEHAHGEYNTESAAMEKIVALCGDAGYRDIDPENTDNGDFSMFDPETDDYIDPVAVYVHGKLEAWTTETSIDWVYDGAVQEITADTTDAEIDVFVEGCRVAAEDEASGVLDTDAVTQWARERRDSLADDKDDESTEPDVIAADGSCVSYHEARSMWENGEFSDWVDTHGFPLEITGEDFSDWHGVEDALSDDQYDV